MTHQFAPLRIAELPPDAAALRERITESRRGVAGLIGLIREDGSLRGPFDPLLRTPAIGDLVQRLGLAVRADTTLSAATCEVAILTTVGLLGCVFETEAHARLAVLRGVLRDEDVRAIAERAPARLGESCLIVAYHASRDQVQDGAMSQPTLQSALELLGERGVVELTVLIAYYQLVAALMGTCTPVPPAA
jgi:4-carboxymuconolactone decarboxylase